MTNKFYVALNGKDTNLGTEQSPFATIIGARDEIRRLRETDKLPHGGVTVYIKEGEYGVPKIILFNELDTGTKDCPINYQATGKVILNGGLTLKACDFKPVNEEVKKTLRNNDAKKNVVQIDLTQYGATKADWGNLHAYGRYHTGDKYEDGLGPLDCELFFNNERMTVARYPNEGYLAIEGVLDNGDASETYEYGETLKIIRLYEKWDNMKNPRGGTFTYNDEIKNRISSWKCYENIWIFGYFKWNWADASTPVKVIDIRNNSLTTSHGATWGFAKDGRYYFYNVLDELDICGEWYLDRSNGMLYIYPPTKINDDTNICLSLSSNDIIRIENADYLTFKGFDVKGSRGNGITATGNNITIEKCKASLLAGGGFLITGYDNCVKDCEISRVGQFGIILNGGDMQTLTPSNNKAQNNLIYNWAEVSQTYQGGITLNGVGASASYNTLFNAPHTAIFYTGNEHVIEYNHIHDVCQNTSDAGAIYSGRSYTWQGNIIRYNYIHNIGSEMGDAHAIYFDDNLSGQTAYGNIIVDIKGAAFLIGGGRQINVTNNIIINADWSIHYDARARTGLLEKGWYGDPLLETADEIRRLRAIDVTCDIWAKKYPLLAKMKWDKTKFADDEIEKLYDDIDFSPNPSYSTVKNNLFYKCKACWNHKHPAVDIYSDFTEEGNLLMTTENPSFVDVENHNYMLNPDSIVFKKLPDFKNISFEF